MLPLPINFPTLFTTRMLDLLRPLRPILISYLTSRGARELLIEILERLAASSDNTLDDVAVDAVRRALLPEVE